MTSPRDNTLSQSIRYLRNGSGLYPTLLKALCVWGNDADKQLMDFLWHDYERYKDTLIAGKEPYKLRELTAWLQRHMVETAKYTLIDYL